MCLFCTLMFVFSALLVFSNSLEHWGCCWIVRIMVGCWLEIIVNGLIMLTKDILRNTKDLAFTFLAEGGGETEGECVWWMDLHCKCPALQLEMTASLSPRCSQSNNSFCFVFWGCSQCAWLTRACKAITLPPEELLTSVVAHLDQAQPYRHTVGLAASLCSCKSRLLWSHSLLRASTSIVVAGKLVTLGNWAGRKVMLWGKK